jgi:hypothetical protein
MFEGLRRRWRFRNLEERIEDAEAEIADAEASVDRYERYERSFGGHKQDILRAERRVQRKKDQHVNLLRLMIERDSL